jgi:hypothetical protein
MVASHIKNNNQREKNAKQQSQEALVLEETARQIGREGQGTRTDLRKNSYEGSGGWDRDVADIIGVSHDTVRKGTDVFRIAYPDKYVHDDLRNPEKYDVSEEVRKEARQQVEAMDDGQTFHGAHVAVKNAIEKVEKEQRREQLRGEFRKSDDEGVEIREGDFSEILPEYESGSINHITHLSRFLDTSV